MTHLLFRLFFMLSIAIKEQNSHFEHGLKIIMTRLTNQW
ncbi:Fimbriae W protein [Salmonella bongori N268-08]|uniref:Fimbriae W protein n=1 Tax=Salmonella bongori N268-08 TaxID=1197719 RepID=S5MSU3_SALBN|nr:Fimbriae W protein [Salmonella bongori N268-08]